MKGIKKTIKLFIYWRLLLFIPLIFGNFFLIYRLGFDYTNLFFYIKPYLPVESPLLFPWANFDGVHYLAIAGRGYVNEARFFPLFPLAIRYLSRLFGGETPFGSIQFFSGLFISNASFLLGLIYFYRLLKLDYAKKVSLKTVFFLLIFPTSFFFGSIYSEGLFFLLLILSFYWARRDKWLVSSMAAALLMVTRPTGFLILPALFYEYVTKKKGKDFLFKLKSLWSFKSLKDLVPLILSPIGLIFYSYFNLQKWGDALYFIKAHGQLANERSVGSIVLIPQAFYRYLKILISIPVTQYEWFVASIELASVVFAFTLLFVAWKKRVRASYLIFSFFALLLPTSSGTFSGVPRYVSVLFPIFIAITLLKNKKLKIVYSLISIVLLIVLLALFSRGYYVS